MHQMPILSLYHAHCELLWRMFRTQYNLSEVLERSIFNRIGAVSSCQGLEADLIILMPGSRPLDPPQLGPEHFFDSHRYLYVMIRARFNLIIISSMISMH